ncbi:MAG TPA: ComEC/Rec2 family competence protein [bacterium]|nr:ComEC/Rec2 family competence protein [bacterium]
MIRAKGSVVVYLALAFVIVLLGAALQPLLWFCALIVCTAVGITLFSASAPGLRLSGVCLLAAALGILLGYMRIPLELRHQSTRRSSLVGLPYRELSGFQGYLLEDSNSSPSGARTYRIRLREIWSVERERRIRLAGGPRLSVFLVVQQGGQNYFLGQGIEVEANLRISEKPGRDHFICWSKADQVRTVGYESPLLAWRAGVRHRINGTLAELDLPVAALLSALILGDRSDLGGAVYTRFRESGSLHLLALSGLHVGVIYFLALVVFAFLPGKKTRVVIATALILIFLFIAGPKPSLLRAVMMLCLGTAALMLDRNIDSLHILALSAVLILLFDPHSLFTLSFQLSFMALLGIVLVGPAAARFSRRLLPPRIGQPLSYAFAAQLATAPLLLSRFGLIYPIGILASLVLLPLVTLFIWLGLLFLIFFTIVPGPLSMLLSALYTLIDKIVEIGALAPGLRMAWKPVYWIPFLMGLIVFFFERRGQK